MIITLLSYYYELLSFIFNVELGKFNIERIIKYRTLKKLIIKMITPNNIKIMIKIVIYKIELQHYFNIRSYYH